MRLARSSQTITAAVLALSCVTLLGAREADACGGFFCATNPVDQNAERILFEVHETGVSATVEISYTGDPADFSWVVPVPEVPTEIAVVPPSMLRLLDRATAPIIVPPPTTCSNPNRAFPAPPSAVGAVDDAESSNGGGVDVTELPSVGPYDDIVVISGEDPEEMIQWLNDNDYLITEEMKPFVRDYVLEGSKFLAMRLAPESGVQDIAPFKFSCPNPIPHVPIRLTAVAAQPEMGVEVFIAADVRYQSANFHELRVDTADVMFDPALQQSNYYPLASWLIDEEGGKAFIAELATSSSDVRTMVDTTFLGTADEQEAHDALTAVLTSTTYLTRLYTRMSGWEMDDDPSFLPNPDASDVSNVHDLSGRAPVEVCGGDVVPPIPCGTTYCGVNSICATVETGADACVCAPGTAARAITAPMGRGLPMVNTVYCAETSTDLFGSDPGAIADACAGFSCGEGGTCAALNGFPTCTCEDGLAAQPNPNQPNGVACAKIVSTFAPEQLLWLDRGERAFGPPTCACAQPGATSVWGGLAASLVVVAASWRRRKVRA